MQCGAKTRSGAPCKANAMVNGRCRLHGGKSLRGASHPATTHGRYSKDLPTRLASRYEEALTDPDLLKLDSEIHLTDAFIRERLATLDTGESGRIWRELNAAWNEYDRTTDPSEAARALFEVGRLIKQGVADYGARQEVLDMMERRRKLVDSEGKRRVQMQQMITAEGATLLVSAIADAVMRHVSDTRTRSAIARDIERLITQPVSRDN